MRRSGASPSTPSSRPWRTSSNCKPAQLKQKTNEQKIAYPRQIAMYLVKELTQASLPEIGRAFGGKHHTTVLHSVSKIEELRQRDRI